MNAKNTVIADLRHRGPMFDGGSARQREELASEWLDEFEGHTDDISGWMDAGFWCPVTARQVHDLGIAPSRVAALCSDITGFDDPVYSMCDSDLDVDALIYDQ